MSVTSVVSPRLSTKVLETDRKPVLTMSLDSPYCIGSETALDGLESDCLGDALMLVLI